MTPVAHSLYGISLFFALESLLLWTKRREARYRAQAAPEFGRGDESQE
jgi:hypothetical protein